MQLIKRWNEGYGLSLNYEKLDKLDLEKDQDIIGQMIDDAYHGSQGYLDELSLVWEENIRFFQGDQHIYLNEVSRSFEAIQQNRFNKFIPTPVTNYILPAVQTLSSVLTRQKPNCNFFPNSHDDQDVQMSKIVSRLQDFKWEEDSEQLLHIQAAVILLLCGTVFRKDYWDSSLGKISKHTNMPIGDNAVGILSPLELIVDIDSQQWFIEPKAQPLSWIRQNYGKKGNGYTGMASEVQEEEDLNSVMSIFNSLKFSSGRGSPLSSRGQLKGHAIVKEAYLAPSKKHLKGLMVVVAGGHTLYVGPSPYFQENILDSWSPYTVCKWQEVFFRFHGLSLVENLISPQKRINSLDALIILNRMTMVAPQWLLPKGCGVPEGYIDGRPSLNIFYNPVGANGARPEKIPGVGLPGDVFAERKYLVEEFYRLAGTNEVVQGLRPEGVNTASGLNLLLEQSLNKFSSQIQFWEKFIELGQIKKMQLIAHRYKEPRPEVIQALRSYNKDNLDVEIYDFIGEDIKDNINLKVEAGSSIPKSKAYEQDNYKQMAQMGLFGPIDPVQNPMANQEFLEKFGMSPFSTEMNADVERARWVVSVLTSINRGIMPREMYPVFRPIDNPDIHKKIITDAMKRPQFRDAQHVFEEKLNEIEDFIAQQAQSASTQPPRVPVQSDGQNFNTEGLPIEAMIPQMGGMNDLQGQVPPGMA